MDPGIIKILEDDEDDNAAPVSGAEVDALAAVLKGDLGGVAAAAAAAAYGLAHSGNGSLQPLSSDSPATASAPPPTGHNNQGLSLGPAQTAQWHKLTPQQQQQYLQRMQQQQLGQPPKRSGGMSQGISFGALMPLLQSHLPPEKNQQLNALYQRFKRNEITREDFVRGARVIVGDQVLVQTIRQMHLKKQHQHQQQRQPQSHPQQLPTSAHPSTPSTSTLPSKSPHDQASMSNPDQPQDHSLVQQSSSQPLQALSLQQQHQHQQQQHQHQQQQQQKLEAQPLSQPSLSTPPLLPQPQMQPQQSRPAEQQQAEVGQMASTLVQPIKHEVEKTSVSPLPIPQALQAPSQGSFASFQPRPSSLGTPQAMGSGSQPSQAQAQAQRAPTPPQFSGLHGKPQFAQPKLGVQTPVPDTASQPLPEKPLSKYARQKTPKGTKKQEEEERMRKLQEADRLRKLQSGAIAGHPPAPQSAAALSMPLDGPQPHPKLLEKQRAAQTLTSVKQEPLIDHHAGGLQRAQSMQPPTKGQELYQGQIVLKVPGQIQLSETVSLPLSVNREQTPLSTSQAGCGLTRYPSIPSPSSSLHSSMPVAAASVGMAAHPTYGAPVIHPPVAQKQVVQQPYTASVAAQVGIPVTPTSGSSLVAGIASMPVAASGVSGHGQPPIQMQGMATTPVPLPSNAASKTPPKKPIVGQKKPAETMAQALQTPSKKQKVQGGDGDQSIDQLNDVTAVSGVNLREEEEQLLAGPKEESRTTEAMRKFVQDEEDRLFLEKGPLRTKVRAIAAKCGIRSVSEDVERCLSMCAEERLRSMLYKLIKLSKQRCDIEKDMHKIVVTSDIRRQVLLMKKKAKEAFERRRAEENERLLKLNEKDKGSLPDAEKEELRAKAQKAQQEEDDKLRANAANVAARAAVGADDMLMKWQMMAAQGLAKRQGGDTANDAGQAGTTDESSSRMEDHKHENGETVLGPGRPDADGDGPTAAAATGRPPGPGPGLGRGSNMVRRPSMASQAGRAQRTISMKDVIAFLEREPQMSKSTLLYRLYERKRKQSSEVGPVKRN